MLQIVNNINIFDKRLLYFKFIVVFYLPLSLIVSKRLIRYTTAINTRKTQFVFEYRQQLYVMCCAIKGLVGYVVFVFCLRNTCYFIISLTVSIFLKKLYMFKNLYYQEIDSDSN